jgi:hypothetical protein
MQNRIRELANQSSGMSVPLCAATPRSIWISGGPGHIYALALSAEFRRRFVVLDSRRRRAPLRRKISR